MPPRAPSVCRHPGCSAKVVGERYCARHQPKWQPWGAHSKRTVRGAAYTNARKALFERQPLCVLCEQAGRVALATIRDHIIPLAHGGLDEESNTQALCTACHDAKSASERKEGIQEYWRGQRGLPSGAAR